MANTLWCGAGDSKLYLQSGQFTSTVKTSVSVSGVDSGPTDISWDGINTPWIGNVTDTLYLTSGQFTSTIKVSELITTIEVTPTGITWDSTNTPWNGSIEDKLYLTSGQFTSTIKTSELVNPPDASPQSITYDGDNTPWCGDEANKLYLTSGQFTSTIKTSQVVVDNAPNGVSWDGANTPFTGLAGQKLYLQSGQFTSTLKTSESITGVDNGITGTEHGNVNARLGIFFTGDINITLPLLTVLGGETGGFINFPLLGVSAEASGSVGDTDIELPIFTISGWAIENAIGIATLPTLTMNASSAAAALVTFPIMTMSNTALQGEVGNLAVALFTLPFGFSARSYNGSAPECVVMNTKNFAVSEYLNFGFNSYTRFNGVDLACDQNGVYEINTASTDNSSSDAYKIKAAIKTGRVDTYKVRIYRLRNAWLNYQTDGDAKLISTANKTKVRTYDLPYKNIENLDEMVERRIKFERGIKDRYFDFKIENVNGSDIEIDKLTVMTEPIISKRR